MKKNSSKTPVSAQITEAVTQSNVKVIAESPAMAMGNLYQTSAHSLGLLFENTVNAQSQSTITFQAVTAQAAAQIFSIESTVLADSIAHSVNNDNGIGHFAFDKNKKS